MAELADAHGSGPCGSDTMRVQVPLSALHGGDRKVAAFVVFKHRRCDFANEALNSYKYRKNRERGILEILRAQRPSGTLCAGVYRPHDEVLRPGHGSDGSLYFSVVWRVCR